MDKSLDDIIASRPRGIRRGSSRRGGPGGRAQILGNGPVSPSARARYAGAVPVAGAPPADKIIVSNLPLDVNEAQIKELFHQTVGPCREVTLHYDAAGRSKGVAAVHFTRKGDATKAYQQYNNRLIDGKRPMRIEIVVDPAKPVPATLASRVAPAGVVDSVPRGGGRGRGRGRGRGGRRNERPVKSAADLDAEMEDYTSTAAAETAAAAPAAS
ncbi:RNA-binding domain-containing protein [Gloeophyllum trabeum ATCC 11539]|uniref:RNA-binding domain-containing protein n=1 Tax=Gloeophyllum trabeum (strain ATCC 11539 / FP-39264 / Madison 617) TaxID=670483 RepID=S7PXT2_GLOTA|nr:RNA-binding domain-containing protein [Gloeophyllum trabeum ATCC 11539]EPQ52328.1 RNA-binding domain-containing protein [Gloeophyllum trabeum ATCC 11539]